MTLRNEYLKHLRIDPRPKLFGFSAPGPVRLRALRELEDRPGSDFLVRHAARDCNHYEARNMLLSQWRTDGTWGTDRLFLRAHGETAANDRALVDTVRCLTLLQRFAWRDDEGDPRLQAAADSILARGQEDGFLGFISRGAAWARSEHVSVFRSDHWGGFACAALLDLGVRRPAIDRFIAWLESNQRPDGGWLPEYHVHDVARNERERKPSHPLHTASAAAALAAHPRTRVGASLRRAVEFLLDRCFTPVGDYARSTAERWRILNEPDFGYGGPAVLTRAADAGYSITDERVVRIIEFLRDRQQDTAFWIPEGKRMDENPDEGFYLTLAIAAAVRRLVDIKVAETPAENEPSTP